MALFGLLLLVEWLLGIELMMIWRKVMRLEVRLEVRLGMRLHCRVMSWIICKWNRGGVVARHCRSLPLH